MKHFLFYLIFSTLSFGAPSPLQELNQLAKDTLSEKGEIQKKLTDDLETKLNTDLGISLPTVRQSIVSLEGGKYSIEIPAEAGCNPWANDLAGKDKGYRDVLESQIQSAAAFLSDFHFRMLGQSHSLFRIRRILICTGGRGITEPKVSYDRARSELTLWIGPHQVGSLPVPSIRRDNLNGLSLEDIRSKWNEGEHFGKQLSFEELVDRNKNPMRAYWNFLNPTGEIRTLLRDAIRVAALKSAGLLDELRRRDGLAGIREKLASLSDNKEIILKADDKKVEEWAKSWQEKMASPAASEEMALAALAANVKKAAERNKSSTVKRRQIGLVNVENFHKIDVQLTQGDIPVYEEMIVVPDTLDIDVSQVGIVNVSTTDRVEVGVAILGLVSPALFERATLKAVVGKKD